MKSRLDPMKWAVRIEPSEALKVVEDRQPLGMFYTIERNNTGRKVIVGIDNRTGDAWTEEFSSLLRCMKWMYE